MKIPSWAHPQSLCLLDSRPCIFHRPTVHKMSEWPYNLRETGLVEGMCVHGVGHPDPASRATPIASMSRVPVLSLLDAVEVIYERRAVQAE